MVFGHVGLNRLFAAVGARGCGKTTTLRLLAEHYGYRVHAEAHNQVLAGLGSLTTGHAEDARHTHIDRADHFCPMCRPFEFCERVLARQAEIEHEARSDDIIDHGWLDAVEYACRRAGVPVLPASVYVPHFAPYSCVFLFAVMPELQVPRWGLTAQARSAEAQSMNDAIAALYQAHGMPVCLVPPGSVAHRADFVHEAIVARRRMPAR